MRGDGIGLLPLIVFVALTGAGCGAHASSSVKNDASSPVGDVKNGALVFQTNCTTCHGTIGTEGGVGPSLRDERVRKDLDATIVWIEHPQPPMPTLYPSPLSSHDVLDVATYVQSL